VRLVVQQPHPPVQPPHPPVQRLPVRGYHRFTTEEKNKLALAVRAQLRDQRGEHPQWDKVACTQHAHTHACSHACTLACTHAYTCSHARTHQVLERFNMDDKCRQLNRGVQHLKKAYTAMGTDKYEIAYVSSQGLEPEGHCTAK
jgi:hypothetical protein